MTFYHVRITPKSDRSHDEVRLDLSPEELRSRFLTPYERGKAIVIGGRTISSDDIERIRITKTAQESRYFRARVEAEQRDSSVVLIGGPSTDWYLADEGKDVTDEIITGAPGWESERREDDERAPRPSADTREVFVVHGRNVTARDALFGFLRSIDLRPIEWSEAVKATGRPTPYIGEILDAAFSLAHAVVVLFTPDDEARLREQFKTDSDPSHEVELSGQARPNVLFEAGMAMGRSEDRTILVELGDLRPFSDIAGRHSIKFEDTTERRQQLAQRLELAGCPVNLEGTAWHSAGDFAAALEVAQASCESSIATGNESAPGAV